MIMYIYQFLFPESINHQFSSLLSSASSNSPEKITSIFFCPQEAAIAIKASLQNKLFIINTA